MKEICHCPLTQLYLSYLPCCFLWCSFLPWNSNNWDYQKEQLLFKVTVIMTIAVLLVEKVKSVHQCQGTELRKELLPQWANIYCVATAWLIECKLNGNNLHNCEHCWCSIKTPSDPFFTCSMCSLFSFCVLCFSLFSPMTFLEDCARANRAACWRVQTANHLLQITCRQQREESCGCSTQDCVLVKMLASLSGIIRIILGGTW